MRSVAKARSLVLSTWLVVVAVVSWGRLAQAHFDLLMPAAADNTPLRADGGKGPPPCGPTGVSNIVTPVQGGHPITISVDEWVGHAGHYRFALSVNSRTELPADPAVTVDTSGLSTSADTESNPVFPVLADNVFPHTTNTASTHQTSVTLPNITCAKCTLQIIEYMNGHVSNPGGGYFYHRCADLQITADPTLPSDGGVSDTHPPTDSGSDTRAGSGGGPGTGGRPGGTGGATANGGNNGAAGTPGSAGATGSGGKAGAGGDNGSVDAGTTNVGTGSSGCGCAIGAGEGRALGGLSAGLLALALVVRRRKR